MIQYFLGGASEETEPFFLSRPLVTLRGLKAIAALPDLTGIKEYYGLGPDREDHHHAYRSSSLVRSGGKRGVPDQFSTGLRFNFDSRHHTAKTQG